MPTAHASMWLYLLGIVGLIVAPGAIAYTGLLRGSGVYLFTAIAEIAVIGAPALYYALKKSPAVWLRLNPIAIKTLLLTIAAAAIGLSAMLMLTLIYSVLLETFGATMRESAVPLPKSGGEMQLAILALAVVPALCEELLFRGVMLPSLEGLGEKRAIIISGALFGLMHMSLSSLPVVVLLGFVLGYLCVKTRSIWTVCVYHFTHNALSLFIGTMASGGTQTESVSRSLSAGQLITAGVAAIGLFIAYFFVIRLLVLSQDTQWVPIESPPRPRLGAVTYIPFCVAMVIIALALLLDGANLWGVTWI